MLVAPEGDFRFELNRIELPPTRFHAVPLEEDETHAAQSLRIELSDLKAALTKQRRSREAIARICDEHHAQRTLLNEFVATHRAWADEIRWLAEGGPEPRKPQPVLKSIRTGNELPDEFALYFEGLVAWHNPAVDNKSLARAAWTKLLLLPEKERKYKSTWAAFMLGKSWEEKEPRRALEYYGQVRSLAAIGFADNLGLAAASLGLEARALFKLKNYEAAIDAYLRQMAAGDDTATNSLLMVATQAIQASPETLASIARNPRAQRVLTAYAMSRRDSFEFTCGLMDSGSDRRDAISRWLEAVELAGIKDIDSAEALALAAYRANNMNAAQGWVKKAGNSPVAQWLQAKLWLREGKVNEAASLLSRLTLLFPVAANPEEPDRLLSTRLESLTTALWTYSEHSYVSTRQIKGELGVLKLTRGEYTQALDSLLNAGYWMDAAYIAERVLTVDELQSYVDGFWPVVDREKAPEEDRWWSADVSSPVWIRKQIRYLLARRLTRELRGDVARQYYPAEWVGTFDSLVRALQAGWNESASIPDRVNGLFSSAVMMRTNGMELVGTEVGPDWHYHDGQFDVGVTLEDRAAITNKWLKASEDELRRSRSHAADPERRFHYRYQAAALAWEAAKLLPDNSDQTAYLLWTAGTFLKNRDPEAADFYYKLLVNRNRRTALGEEADRQRWFPEILDDGTIVRRERKPRAKSNEGADPVQEGVDGMESAESQGTIDADQELVIQLEQAMEEEAPGVPQPKLQ